MSWIFAAPQQDEQALLDRAADLAVDRVPGLPMAGELADATRRHGADLATALALHAIRTAPGNREELARLAAVPIDGTPLPASAPALAIVPTMYHRERPELGGDGALVRAVAGRLGLRTTLIATDSLGSISGNAVQVIRHLEAMPEPAWFVTISKGTADLKRALVLRPDLGHRLCGWISLAGMPGGSLCAAPRPGQPIAHAMLEGWLRLRGARPGMLAEMAPQHPFSLAALALPPAVTVVNVVPMPMGFHLRKPVDRAWSALAGSGPNDGYVLLEHALLPGVVVPMFGQDHYLRGPETTATLYRLLRLHLGGVR